MGEYAAGDIVCYRKEDQGWSPAWRLIGFDGNKTAWLICAGTPVCAAVDRLRPATSAEALAMQFAQNAKYEPGHPEDQQAFVDARASLNRDEDELVDDSLEDRPVQDTNDPETPHSLMEPEFEHGNTPPKTRPRSSEELMNDGLPSVVELRYLLGNWISRLESYGQIKEPRFPITGTTVVLLNPDLSLSKDNKIVRGTRQTR